MSTSKIPTLFGSLSSLPGELLLWRRLCYSIETTSTVVRMGHKPWGVPILGQFSHTNLIRGADHGLQGIRVFFRQDIRRSRDSGRMHLPRPGRGGLSSRSVQP